ncbi:uncharacterized protein LOC113770895 [Coffea eugenioides]|uniref:Protein ECERIFERUM 16-like n=1 Tax=Coffea arabica TaxID=13443 RepID=A0A6P6XJT2_COFAR|nr:uncharacterized protein LOC113743610 [Coffea arabica]XP_027127459.1 uncharacterized protein LOC113743610 [Coffea arabica]XP_027171317.1 uncharacterized protein LOC113770895 [Coffea eugenioides]XP_027171318.1 uncharacterized protein LOC113770895 [Coffea eugenioides]
MDAKALAKSKRAHSLHHSKKHHSSPTSKATPSSATSSSGKKPTNKQARDKPYQSQSSKALPTNWDRYEEEYGSGSEDSPQVSTGQASDVVVPKSKGADYAYLISEAKAQSQANSSSESFGLFDDFLDGFNQGLGPLLSVRGEHLLSRISNDVFPFDDKGTSSHEASFLSLNLHSLAEQLSKANLAERLFIEPDLLPPEMCTELYANNEKNPDELQATGSTKATESEFAGQPSSIISKENRNILLSQEYMSSNSSRVSQFSVPTSIDHRVDDLKEISGSTSVKLTSGVSIDSSSKKPSRFEAAKAEAELDMLLDSFGETKFFDSSWMAGESSQRSGQEEGSTFQSVSVAAQHVREGPDATYSGRMDAALDDSLDDILKDTSHLINTKAVSPLNEVKAASNEAPTASQPHSKSKILDDFDSWLDTI